MHILTARMWGFPTYWRLNTCKYQKMICQRIMYTTWGITRKLRQCLQFSCTWAPKPWNHWWKGSKTPRNLGSKLCNWGLQLISLAFQTWTYNLFWPIIQYRLINYIFLKNSEIRTAETNSKENLGVLLTSK